MSSKPSVSIPSTNPPADLVIEDLTVGTGKEATKGTNVEVHYVGVAWSTGKQFDASWDRNEAFEFRLGAGQVIAGWDQGVAGMKVGAVVRSPFQRIWAMAIRVLAVLLKVAKRLFSLSIS
jgi:FKBP-type peptidyl-prolyl cis-trans isomerase